MKILAWNCRGIGNSITISYLCELIKVHSPSIILVSEVKNPRDKVAKILSSFNLYKWHYIEPSGQIGTSGGLLLMWIQTNQLIICQEKNYFIQADVTTENSVTWNLIGVYCSTDHTTRMNQFSELSLLVQNLQWYVILGDFNAIISSSEKSGGTCVLSNELSGLDEFVFSNALVDPGFIGHPYTWNNKRGAPDNIQKRLDRVLMSGDMRMVYPEAVVRHMEEIGSDHRPLLLDLKPNLCRAKRQFKYDARWAENESAVQIVNEEWQQSVEGPRMYQVFKKLKNCRHKLVRWNCGGSTNSQRKISTLKNHLAELQSRTSSYNRDEVLEVEQELSVAYQQEELFWYQKSRVQWLNFGDQNTSFFHAMTIGRRHRNSIKGIYNEQGNWVTEALAMQTTIQSYFQNIYTTVGCTELEQVTNGLGAVITPQMSRSLLKQVTSTEIRKAAFSISPMKAPGADGFTGKFFQTHWHILGNDINLAIRDFFRTGRLFRGFNHTLISLIPKVPSVQYVNQLRPISLCNIFYKIIAKVLARRLKNLLPKLISLNQSAFVSGRLITDNVLVAHELSHALKIRRSGKDFDLALKLDMSKAYDRVEWQYLRHMMQVLGFPLEWISWIIECVTTVSYSILINGEPKGFFHPTRGLRQGCPLSPYLFLFCTEGFSNLINQHVVSGALHGLRISRSCPRVSHLFFADDSLVFFRACPEECETFLKILKLYENASGQIINLQKSALSFSRNTPIDLQELIVHKLQVGSVGLQDKYLGLPSIIERSKTEVFSEIRNKVAQKLQGWKRKMLSFAGKETLIKAVATSMPVYTMSCFLLPQSLCQDISRLVARFWWGQRNSERKIHWIKWQKLCQSKSRGGLGFRDFQAFNIALLAKQGWRLIHEKNTLLYKIYRGRYFRATDFLNANVGGHPSWAWRGILVGRDALTLGLRWRVGNGRMISIRDDPWLPSEFPFKPKILQNAPIEVQRVSDLLIMGRNEWNVQMVKLVINESDCDYVLSLPLSNSFVEDKLIWNCTRNGIFSVKSCYHLIYDTCLDLDLRGRYIAGSGLHTSPNWKLLWSLSCPPKMKHFLWRALSNCLAVNVNLKRRIPDFNPICPVCKQDDETVVHLLTQCTTATQVWFESKFGLRSELLPHGSLIEWWNALVNDLLQLGRSKEDFVVCVYIFWNIWKARNEVVFNQSHWPIQLIITKVNEQIQEYMEAKQGRFTLEGRRNIPPSVRDDVAIWLPPPMGFYKVNFDGAINKDSRIGSIGFVVRDYTGTIILAGARRFPGIVVPIVIEALALRTSMEELLRIDHQKLIFEGDCQILINAINSSSSEDRDAGVILEDIFNLVSNFSEIRFQFVSRSCNWVAHSVAKKALVDDCFCRSHHFILEWLTRAC